jgi:large subunit ribosomal protein L24
MQARRIKKGDMVEVIAGKEKGKSGKVMKVLGEENRVVVEKVNFIKKHTRPDAKGKGGIVEKEASLHL